MATLHELNTIYGVEDAYDLLEILHTKNANALLAQKQAEKK